MQTMVIEYARNVCGLERANSTELGGTMRLGAYPCQLAEGSFARQAYGAPEISERHRHRYEFNREFEGVLTSHGLRLTGQTPDGMYVEICEVADHPWYLGCQFHPEFKSKPLEPHPLFSAFVGAALKHRRTRMNVETREYMHAG
jgi:CTP synthase